LTWASAEKPTKVSIKDASNTSLTTWSATQGQASDIILRAAEMERTKQRLNNLYVHHTGQPYNIVEQALDRDNYMTALEAKEFGLIDQVIQTAGKGSLEDVISSSAATTTAPADALSADSRPN